VQLERLQKAHVAVISIMDEKHWPSVREIYQAGIDTGHGTFESSSPESWEKGRDVAPAAKGRGVGRQLLGALIERSEDKNIWTLQAGIFPENVGSVALHQALGFHTIGVRQRLGKMRHGPLAGQWRDVLALGRRSTRVGIAWNKRDQHD